MLVHGLTPASSSEFIKADGSEAEEDSSDILQCAFGFEQGLKHDPAVPWPSRWPWGTSTVGLPVQAPGSENANIWQYIAILPYIGILPIYWQYVSYCRGALVRHIAGRSGPTMFSRSQVEHALIFFGIFFWEKYCLPKRRRIPPSNP